MASWILQAFVEFSNEETAARAMQLHREPMGSVCTNSPTLSVVDSCRSFTWTLLFVDTASKLLLSCRAV